MTNEINDKDTSGPKKRMTDAEFASARECYELGTAGISELAAQFGVTRQTLAKRFKDNNIIKGSRSNEIAKEVKASVERFADQQAAWIEETRLTGFKSLKQIRIIAQKLIVEAVQAKKPLGYIDEDLKALSRANKILIDNLAATMSSTILDAESHIDDQDLAVLTIEDLTDQDILDHHINTGALPEDANFSDLNLQEDMD